MSFLINPYGFGYHTNAVNFDGTNDYLTRGAKLTGIADGKKGLISFWVKFNGGDGTTQTIAATSTNGIAITRTTGNKFSIIGLRNVGTSAVTINSNTAITASSGWSHILASWDAATSFGKVYLNGTDDTASTFFFNDNIIYSNATNFGIGGTTAGGNKLNADFSDLYLNFAESADITTSTIRDKFRTVSGKPEYLGVDGSLPTGTAPIVFLKGQASSFNTNLGTGGNFTVTGALTDSSTSPSD
jgi:hypothetical protein